MKGKGSRAIPPAVARGPDRGHGRSGYDPPAVPDPGPAILDPRTRYDQLVAESVAAKREREEKKLQVLAKRRRRWKNPAS